MEKEVIGLASDHIWQKRTYLIKITDVSTRKAAITPTMDTHWPKASKKENAGVE